MDTNHHLSLLIPKAPGEESKQTVSFSFCVCIVGEWDNLFLHTTTTPLTSPEILQGRECTTSTTVGMHLHTTTIPHLLFIQLLLSKSCQVIDTCHSLGFVHMANVSHLGPTEKDDVDITFLW